ncbi:MAG: hypothetical protein M3076_04280 [Actinomycetota bacterium]|nr:hypothetical protein [Actinomycetota bacterium]
MRVDLEVAEPLRSSAKASPVWPAPAPGRRIDGFDLAVLGAFACVSLWILALDLWQVLAHGRVWTGTDGIYLVDQMQYLAWIRDAAHHLFASNLFVLRSTPSDYFQPAVAISGALTAVGVPPWLALLLWKPVAVLCVFFGTRRYVRDTLTGKWPRRAALVLAIFYGAFSVVYGSFGVVGDLQFTFLSWGYTFGLLAVGLLLLALISYDRARARGRRIWLPGLLGAIASLLHPWQGELLIVLILSVELVMWLSAGRRLRQMTAGDARLPALTILITALPLLYYLVLGNLDLSWELARDASKHAFSIWTILLAIGPLMVPAALGYRRRASGFLPLVTRLWLPAALAIYILSASGLSATPLHAFDGVTVPLAVLAVQGAGSLRVARHRRRWLLGAAAVGLATIPATVYLLGYSAGLAAPTPGNANFIAHDEQRALRYLARDRDPGGVLSRFYLGSVIPGQTGRRTFVGDCLWSEPDCMPRAQVVQALFSGAIAPAAARSLVHASGARFVLSDCQVTGNLAVALAPITVSVRRFGCAKVYEVDGP